MNPKKKAVEARICNRPPSRRQTLPTHLGKRLKFSSRNVDFINSLFAMSVDTGGSMTNEEMDKLIYEYGH